MPSAAGQLPEGDVGLEAVIQLSMSIVVPAVRRWLAGRQHRFEA